MLGYVIRNSKNIFLYNYGYFDRLSKGNKFVFYFHRGEI